MSSYLDNSATTKPCKKAVLAAKEVAEELWGNPSSLYEFGTIAKKRLEKSRADIAKVLSADKNEVFFSPSGTIANNTAIYGAITKGNLKNKKKIVTTAAEHPSVLNFMKRLSEQGYDVKFIKLLKNGNLNLDDFQSEIDENTSLVSIMAINNETGAKFPIDKIKNIIEGNKSSALFHIDAVQGFLKTELDIKHINADILTASAHKVHGIKGAGLLYVKKGLSIKPYVLGGGQERGIFSGTESMPAICAFSEAVMDFGDISENEKKVRELNLFLRKELAEFSNVKINSPENASSYILNFSCIGVPSQVMLNILSENEVYVSAGSACSKGHRSDTLMAMGLSSKELDSAIRVSFSKYSTEKDVLALINGIKIANKRLNINA